MQHAIHKIQGKKLYDHSSVFVSNYTKLAVLRIFVKQIVKIFTSYKNYKVMRVKCKYVVDNSMNST